eukprot:4517132-Pleurochrysis_carterae.AAC.1
MMYTIRANRTGRAWVCRGEVISVPIENGKCAYALTEVCVCRKRAGSGGGARRLFPRRLGEQEGGGHQRRRDEVE